MRERASVAVALAFVVAVSLACGSSKTSPPPPASAASAAPSAFAPVASAPPPKPVHPPQGDATDLGKMLGTYKENEVRGDALYKGKRLVIAGKVGEVKKGITGDDFYVTLGTGALFEHPTVQAFFDAGESKDVAMLSKGDALTVDCACEGLTFNVVMKDCRVPKLASAARICSDLVAKGLAAKCLSGKDFPDPAPGTDMAGFMSAAGLRGLIVTFLTKGQLEDEVKAAASDKTMSKMTLFPSTDARVIVAILDTALASEKDALKAFVEGL